MGLWIICLRDLLCPAFAIKPPPVIAAGQMCSTVSMHANRTASASLHTNSHHTGEYH